MRSRDHRQSYARCVLVGAVLIGISWCARPAPAQEDSPSDSILKDSVDSYSPVYESVMMDDSSMGCLTCQADSWRDRLTLFAGVDGSKQPQDLGVNANLGGQFNLNFALPLNRDSGLALQIGSGIVTTGNAVRVYELLGESTSRVQSFTTVGLFQRSESGIHWGAGYDFLYQDSYDSFELGQWRGQIGFQLTSQDEIGVRAQLRARGDTGQFNATQINLQPLSQGSLYYRRFWESGAQTTFWVGFAEGHSEDNIVTGPAPAQDEPMLFGADVLAPLNDFMALYGETNLIMPPDTGTVDAFFGFQFFPGGGARMARRRKFDPVMSVASPTTFSVDGNR